MLRKNELRSVVNETVLEWLEKHYLSPNMDHAKELVDNLVENIQETWFN